MRASLFRFSSFSYEHCYYFSALKMPTHRTHYSKYSDTSYIRILMLCVICVRGLLENRTQWTLYDNDDQQRTNERTTRIIVSFYFIWINRVIIPLIRPHAFVLPSHFAEYKPINETTKISLPSCNMHHSWIHAFCLLATVFATVTLFEYPNESTDSTLMIIQQI